MLHDHAIDPIRGTAEAFAYFREACQTTRLSKALLDKAIPGGLHRSHLYIINHLVRSGDGQQPVQIATAVQVTKATMSHSLAVLEKRGFIKTIRCEMDARSKKVFLTESGREIQAQAVSALTSIFDSFLREEDYRIMGEALPSLIAIRKLLDKNRTVFPDR